MDETGQKCFGDSEDKQKSVPINQLQTVNNYLHKYETSTISSILALCYLLLVAMGQRYTRYVNPLIGTGGLRPRVPGCQCSLRLCAVGPDPSRSGDRTGARATMPATPSSSASATSTSRARVSANWATWPSLPVSCCKQAEVKFAHESENVAPGYYSVKLKTTTCWWN